MVLSTQGNMSTSIYHVRDISFQTRKVRSISLQGRQRETIFSANCQVLAWHSVKEYRFVFDISRQDSARPTQRARGRNDNFSGYLFEVLPGGKYKQLIT
jgi:hypothetical protein